MKFSIIIPCYNEEKNIDNLIQKIRPLQEKCKEKYKGTGDLEYILVENGSLDNSKEYFKKNIENKFQDIKVVYVEKNKGYGFGIAQGIKASLGEYIGWIHADMQIAPLALEQFFDYIIDYKTNSKGDKKLFLKGLRKNRSFIDYFFTYGQSLFNTILFKSLLFDIGAIPVVFDKSLIKDVEALPNDFSLELYVYKEAKRQKFLCRRFSVNLAKRKKGASSWNFGWKSKIKQSIRIFKNSLKIKRGEKVL
ncbi:MAG: glycosyltransferase family 2 protein [Bdellovibrionota bacterium]